MNSNKNSDKKSKFIFSRRMGRVLAFQALYSYDIEKKDYDDFAALIDEDPEPGVESKNYAKEIVKGTLENLDNIDNVISKHLINWRFARLNSVNRSILRFSVYSMLYDKEVAPEVVIAEAVEIAKEFGEDDAYKFINGLLDAVKKEQ